LARYKRHIFKYKKKIYVEAYIIYTQIYEIKKNRKFNEKEMNKILKK